MSNNLIIAPVYPPDFHWATQLLDSASIEENIAIGFSNQNDADSFQHSFPYKTLISTMTDNDQPYVNKKKLDLLKQAYKNYDYVAVIDIECKFLRPTTPFLKNIWDENCFVANHSIDGKRIMKEAVQACGYDYQDDLYIWFNTIPVYKTELLPGFFQWIEERNIFGAAFEFILFSIYCRYELNMPWRVLDGSAWHGLVENKEYWAKYPHLINQVSWSTYQKGIEKHSNIKMLFHLDRVPIK